MNLKILSIPLLSGLYQTDVPHDQWEIIDVCPICQSHHHIDTFATVEGSGKCGAITSVCNDCEFRFLSRRPKQSWFNTFYTEIWDTKGKEEKIGQVLPRTKILDFCQDVIPAKARVLDIGAGFGRDILAFKEAGFSVAAIENSEHRSRFISNELGIPSEQSSIEALIPKNEYDLVYSHHVLEHSFDPNLMIEKSAQMLNANGFIYVAVPNLWEEHLLQALHFVPHIYAFTLKSLTRLLKKYGFEVVKSQVGREIQIVAQKTGDAMASVPDFTDLADSSDNTRQEFSNKLYTYSVQSLGNSTGYQTYIWYPDKMKQKNYETYHVSSSSVYPQMVRFIYHVLPLLPSVIGNRVRYRLLPAYFRNMRHVRILGAKADTSGSLPITVLHEPNQKLVWLK